MTGFAGASTLCRVLMTLGRSRATGRLHVEAGPCRGSLSLHEGSITAVRLLGAESKPLGDLLDANGAWDEARHAEALFDSDVAGPVGAWLVRHRVSSEAAVLDALRAQALSRVQLMCSWDAPELRFEDVSVPDPGRPLGRPLSFEPLPAPHLVLRMLRTWAQRIDPILACARLTGQSLQLSAAGHALQAQPDALREAESRLLTLLDQGTSVEDAVLRSGTGEWGFGFVRALELIAAVERRSLGAYPLLLQKRRQVREAASAHTLLDLPPGAGPEDARRALRRLVSDLHPDRLGDGVPAELHRVCGEVIRALVAADSRIAGTR